LLDVVFANFVNNFQRKHRFSISRRFVVKPIRSGLLRPIHAGSPRHFCARCCASVFFIEGVDIYVFRSS
jgi:hypothetical protein